ncbi:MAG: Eco57I restriction-modification methylase domain-containing protein [Bacteroidales bacterium]|nr:Eco57I restriction-modification methylase domain-containing protein [Bacteroidales bacterium]
MSLFQKSVINKYLKNLDNEKVSKAYENFQKFYGDKLRLHNIMQLKEENYQEGFLREIFVETLGYTINPDNDFNLTTEYKNQKDARKADGAIVATATKRAIAVIELKSTKTKHLESIKEQAFSYKNNQPGCRYVITSNFQSLRFYIDDATEYEEFNLFNLKEKDFKLLYLLLSKESIFSDLPEKLKQETKFHENDISAQLYTDYKRFKNNIFENLVKNNPQHDKLLLFKKSQKLLDRFLFVFFAEDSGLIPPNAVSKIVEQWKMFKENDEYFPLYSRFQKLFSHLDKGYTYKTWGEIPAYNGGLFRNDELLDSTELKIDDEVLEKDSLTLSAYDFNTEVDVNILGHIFEHSLNEIEEITAKLSATAETRGHVPLKKKKTKRKKDGIFYTPKYITKYIVENTVGTLCKEKKEELKINNLFIDDTYRRTATTRGRVPLSLSEKGKKLYKILNTYKDWLLTLKILDPACGSGAFLNATLDFLIAEHKQTDNLIAELTGDALGLFDTDKAILENNIFGVDINEESVEIAKLSMWLRTAQKGRPLSDLSGNIKCGNSLIDDPEVAGDKAFDWHKEFPQIFKRKDKEAWHITLATHDSRTSQRMIDHKVRLKRDGGMRPKAEPIWLDTEDELFVTKHIAEIIKEDNLNVTAYNICGDHVHLLLVCEKEEMSKIVGKIKAVSAREYNIEKGITIPETSTNESDTIATRGHVPLSENYDTEHVPLSKKETNSKTETKKKKYNSLWVQKFGKKKITDKEQYRNTLNYIVNNRIKHELPENKDLQSMAKEMSCTAKHAFRAEYKGGFDVVIGNPPYINLQGLKANYEKETAFYKKMYKSATSNYDIYVLFIEKSFFLINEKGKVSYILPHKFLISEFGKGIRGMLTEQKAVQQLLHFGSEMVFADASTYTCILTLSHNNSFLRFKQLSPSKISEPIKFDNIKYENLNSENWNLNSSEISKVLDKLDKQPYTLKNAFNRFVQGIITGKDAVFCIKGELKGQYINHINDKGEIFHIEAKITKQHLRGEDIGKYRHLKHKEWLIFPYEIKEGKAVLYSQNEMKNNFPNTWSYLQEFEQVLRSRERDKFDNDLWFQYSRNQAISVLEQPKIITPEICFGGSMTIDLSNFYHNSKCHSLLLSDETGYDLKSILPILNSSVFWFFASKTGNVLRGGYIGIKRKLLEAFPLPNLPENQQPFIEKADQMLSLNKELQNKSEKFIKRIKSNLEIEKITKKLQNFYDYDFKTFIAELKKQKIKLSLTQQDEWEDYFDTYKQEINQVQTQISQTDKEIDKMVYELYELTEEEIGIIENSVK